MIGLIILPFYFVYNIFLNKLLLKWLSLFTDLGNNKYFKYSFLIIQMILTISLYIAFILPSGVFKKYLSIAGNYYLGIMIYSSLILLILLLLKLIVKNLNKITYNVFGFISIISIIIIIVYGVFNSNAIHTTRYEVNINKKANVDSLNIVMVADLHIGYNKGYKLVKNMVNKINKEKPDVVIIAGDIFDNDYDAIDNPDEIKKELESIQSKYGVYAVYGNHDVKEKVLFGFTFHDKNKKYSDIRMNKLLEDSNIKLLNDEYIDIENIIIYGRPDLKKFSDRKNVKDVTKKLDKNKPIIIIDHQPKELDELSRLGVDLDLSGHTHDGQIFPLNLIVKMFYKNSYGMKKIGNMTSIVTSGVGLYGPNIRVLTKAEITVIKVNFN